MSHSVGSQQSVVPSGLPMLPGNGFKDPTKIDCKKSHIFDCKNGINTVSRDPTATAPKGPVTAVEPPKMQPKAEVSVVPVQPAWVAFDRKVLRFDCYFKESVHESRLENYRIRKCVLYYYLEDDSMHVSEPKVENSGIPQARLHRGRVGHRSGLQRLGSHEPRLSWAQGRQLSRVPADRAPRARAARDLSHGRRASLRGGRASARAPSS